MSLIENKRYKIQTHVLHAKQATQDPIYVLTSKQAIQDPIHVRNSKQAIQDPIHVLIIQNKRYKFQYMPLMQNRR